MKKVILLVLLGLVYFEGKSQLTDAQLIAQADTIKNETRAGANTATRVGRMFENIIYNKINNSKFIDSTKIPYLAKNNNFTGNNTFPNINVSNNNDASGLSVNGDITTIGDINNNDAGTALSIDGHYNTLTINGLLGFTSGQLISSISTDTAMTSYSNAILPTQNAVKSYVTNHTPNVSGFQTVSNLSNSLISDSSSTTKYTTVQSVGRYAQSLSNLSNNVTSDSASTTKYPSVNAVKRYVQANSSSLPYTEYACLITQTSTSAPTLTVLSNNTGGTFTATRVASGYYTITFSGVTTTTSKMFPIISCTNAQGLIVSAYSQTSTTITIQSLNLSGIPTDGIMTNTPFFIRFYP